MNTILRKFKVSFIQNFYAKYDLKKFSKNYKNMMFGAVKKYQKLDRL